MAGIGVLGQQFVPAVAVVADSRRADQDSGTIAGDGKSVDQPLRALHAAVADASLDLRRPFLRHWLAGKMNHRIRSFESVGGSIGRGVPFISGRRAAAQSDDVVAGGPQVGEEFATDESAGSGNGDPHDLLMARAPAPAHYFGRGTDEDSPPRARNVQATTCR